MNSLRDYGNFISLPIRIALVIILLSFFFISCEKKSASESLNIEPAVLGQWVGTRDAVAQDSSLTVLYAAPQGPLSQREIPVITVMFSHPMVALTEESQRKHDTGPLSFEPALKGQFQWVGTRTLLFYPSEHLAASTDYTATLSSTITTVNGKTWPAGEPFRFHFSAAPIVLTDMTPQGAWEKLSFRDTLLVKFNYPVTPSIKSSLSLTYSDGTPIPFDLHVLDSLSYHSRLHFYDATFAYERSYFLRYASPSRVGFISFKAPLSLGKTINVTFNDRGRISGQTATVHSALDVIEKPLSSIEPGSSFTLEFSTPVSSDEVIKHVTLSPAPDTLERQSFIYTSTHHSLPYSLKPNSTYTLRVSSELQDIYGQRLMRNRERSITTSDYSSYLYFPSGRGIMEAAMPPSMSSEGMPYRPMIRFSSMNLPSIELNYCAISLGDMIRFLQRGQSTRAERLESLLEKAFQKDLRTTTLNFPAVKNREQKIQWALSKALPEGKRTGFVLLSVPRPEVKRYHPNDVFKDQAFIQITDIGITAKTSPKGALIFLTSLQDGVAIQDASIRLYSQGKEVWKGKTNQEGIALALGITLPISYSDYEWNDGDIAIVAEKGDDAAILFNTYDGIESYRFGLRTYDKLASRTMAHLYTERGIYRAGETVHIAAVAREFKTGKWASSLSPMELLIQNPMGETLIKKTIRPQGRYSSYTDSLVIPDASPLGQYSMMLREMGGSQEPQSWYGSFQVEAYRPATFSTSLRPKEKHIVKGRPWSVLIEGRYLFGAPLSQSPLRWSLTQSALPSFHFADYDGYFWQPLDWARENALSQNIQESGQGVLDEEGRFTLNQVAKYDLSRPTLLTLETTLTSPTQQSLSDRTSLVFHPASFYIGLKPKTVFSSEYQMLPISLITLTPSSERVEKTISLELIHRQWISVKRAGVGGRFEWDSEKVDSIIDRKSFKTSLKEPIIYNAPIKGAGLYFIRATATDEYGNRTESETYAYAYGKSFVAWERDDHDRIELISDKIVYKPGETASVLVKSPFDTATALITVEREGILQHRTTTLIGSAPSIDIPINDLSIPNVYVSVVLIKGRVSYPQIGEPDFGKPQFRIGYLSLSVEKYARALQVSIVPKSRRYAVNDVVEADIFLKDEKGNGVEGEVFFAAVDAGVLNLIGYTLPNLFETFYRERSLTVRTSEGRLNLIEQRNFGQKGEEKGGDKGGDGLGGFAFRKNFMTTAAWRPALKTDQTGKVRVTFRLPDNLTTFRLMAEAHTEDRFGAAQSDIIVEQPLMMLDILPRFLRVGDSIQAGVSIHNYTEKTLTLSLTLDARGIDLSGKNSRTITIPPGKQHNALYALIARAPGNASLRFTVEGEGYRDALIKSIPISLPETQQHLALFGSTDSNCEETVFIPKAVYDGYGGLSISASPSVIAGLSEAVRYVFEYPYGCLEQQISALLPYLYAEELITRLSITTPFDSVGSSPRIEIEKRLAALEHHQTPKGGFSYWPGGAYESEYLSVYALHAIILAERRGISVSRALKQRAVRYVQTLLSTRRTSYYGKDAANLEYAYASYVLTLTGDKTLPYLQHLYEIRATLSLEARSYLLRSLNLIMSSKGNSGALFSETEKKHSTVMKELLSLGIPTGETLHFEERLSLGPWAFSSAVKTTSRIAIAILESTSKGTSPTPEIQHMIQWLINSQNRGRWATTIENAAAIEVLAYYVSRYEREAPQFKWTILANQRQIGTNGFTSFSAPTFRETLSLSSLPKGNPFFVTFSKEGSGRLYYNARLSYLPKTPLPAADQGIAVAKQIEVITKKTASRYAQSISIPIGSVVKITLTVSIPHDMHFVAVNDPLPAGLEAINPRLKVSSIMYSTPSSSSFNEEEGVTTEMPTSGFDYSGFYDHRLQLFAETLPRGVHTFTYFARATTAGVFSLPGTVAEQMYSPERFGRTGSQTWTIIQ